MESGSESETESSVTRDADFYDESADTQDAAWVGKQHPGPTDAVLACPMCFVQICFVCQHHSKYAGQYRALSVVNCEVRDTVLYTFGRRGLLEPLASAHGKDPGDVFRLVVCAECDTKVGVIDSADIYHLFHVLDDTHV